MKTVITGGTLLAPLEEIPGGWLLIDGDRIAARGTGSPPPADRIIDAAGRYVAPGFLDLHVQGFRGFDLCDPDESHFLAAVRQMAAAGVTSCQASVDATEDVARVMRPRIGRATGGARLVGLYFESPFIAPEKRGAIPLDRLRPPSVEAAREILGHSSGILSMITIAPELPGALDLVRLFRLEQGPAAQIVTALGHTAATFDEAVRGLDAGMTHCTHLYNAMTGLHHRRAGAVGALLAHPSATVEIVCDGVHVHPAAVRVAVSCKGPDRVCLITDAVSGLRGTVVDGAPRLSDGTIAGSILSMDRAVDNVRRFAGVSILEAVRMATLTPARVLGMDGTLGSLDPGKAADVILFDEDVRVSLTIIGGREAGRDFPKDAAPNVR